MNPKKELSLSTLFTGEDDNSMLEKYFGNRSALWVFRGFCLLTAGLCFLVWFVIFFIIPSSKGNRGDLLMVFVTLLIFYAVGYLIYFSFWFARPVQQINLSDRSFVIRTSTKVYTYEISEVNGISAFLKNGFFIAIKGSRSSMLFYGVSENDLKLIINHVSIQLTESQEGNA